MEAIACVDTAVWDLLGKRAGLSVRQLLGGFRSELPIISIGGYYAEGKTLLDLAKEMELYDSIRIGNIEILGNFRGERLFTSEDQINQADVIDGNRYVNLKTIIAFKNQLGRDKDKRDLELIENYLAKTGKNYD